MPEIILTTHAINRLGERGINLRDVKSIARIGYIKKNNLRDILIKSGELENGRTLTVVMQIKKVRIIIITAYYEN